MGIFQRMKDRREERQEQKDEDAKSYSKKADPDAYFEAFILVIAFAIFALYTIVKEYYFG